MQGRKEKVVIMGGIMVLVFGKKNEKGCTDGCETVCKKCGYEEKSSSYRNGAEAKIFGSDMNKWVNQNCEQVMSVCNIDMVIFKRFGARNMKIVESKRFGESLKDGQNHIFTELKRIIQKGMVGEKDILGIEFLIIYHDKDMTRFKVVNMGTKEELYIETSRDIAWFKIYLKSEGLTSFKQLKEKIKSNDLRLI